MWQFKIRAAAGGRKQRGRSTRGTVGDDTTEFLEAMRHTNIFLGGLRQLERHWGFYWGRQWSTEPPPLELSSSPNLIAPYQYRSIKDASALDQASCANAAVGYQELRTPTLARGNSSHGVNLNEAHCFIVLVLCQEAFHRFSKLFSLNALMLAQTLAEVHSASRTGICLDAS